MKNESIKQNFWLSFLRFMTRSVLVFFLTVMMGILFFVFLYFGDLFINSITNNHRKPLFGIYIIASDSMVPTIDYRDGIVIKRKNSGYEVGDIITYSIDSYYEGKLITHRVVGKEKEKNEYIYITKGDHNSSVDPVSIREEDIYGKVLFHIPKLGYVQNFFSSIFLYFILIFLALSGFLLGRFFLNRRKEKLV